MTNDIDETRRAVIATTDTETIKRISAPETANGSRWEVKLSAIPSREWLEFFKTADRASGGLSPQIVVFDRASASFKSDEAHVEQWIQAIDKWIATADARYRASVDEARVQRSLRLDAEAEQRERIQQMNDRFKNL